MSSPQRGGAAAVPIAAPEPERPSWCDAEASAQHAIEHIIHQGSRLVYEHYLQEREDSLLASELLTDIYGVLAIAFGEPDREIIVSNTFSNALFLCLHVTLVPNSPLPHHLMNLSNVAFLTY